MRACMRPYRATRKGRSARSSIQGYVPWKEGRDARQACRALDASEKSAEEDGVDAEVHEFSEHFWNT